MSTNSARLIRTGVAGVAAILLTAIIAAAQEPTKFPDWSGQWVRGPGMGTGWDGTIRLWDPFHSKLLVTATATLPHLRFRRDDIPSVRARFQQRHRQTVRSD